MVPSSQIPEPDSEVQHQLEAANSQLAVYARDLRQVLNSQRQEAHKAEMAYQQLQMYARDLKTTLVAERQKSQELAQAYSEIVVRLTQASKYRDQETGAHIQRVSHYSRLIALHLGWTPAAAELLFKAAPMHDVGKIGVPDAVLLKPGPLTPSEWEVMKCHTTFGASLLNGLSAPLLQMSRDIALSHHEHWDGSGYPQGLQGEAIPQVGRILKLADVYDALRSQRPYKPAFDHDITCTILLQGDQRTQPSQFDPQILDIFRENHPEFAAIYNQIADSPGQPA